MRRAIGMGAALLLTAALAGSVGAAATPSWKAPPFQSIGIAQVFLGDEHYNGSGAMDVFIPTGSGRNECLTTFAGTNQYPWPHTLFCGARTMVIDGVATQGLRVIVWWGDPPIVFEPGLSMVVNVYQEGARYFGAPIVYVES